MTTVVVGIGNRMRGDDAVGPLALDMLRPLVGPDVACVECRGDVSEMIDAFRGADRVVVIDAVISGAEPGTLHVVDGRSGIPARWRSASTHLVGLGEAIELAWALQAMPDELTVYGVEAATAAAGAPMTPEVEATVARIVATVAEVAHA